MKRFFLFILLTFTFVSANCQYKTATFSDRSTVDYKIISTDPENGPKVTLGVFWALTNNEGRPLGYYNASFYSRYFTVSTMYKKQNYGLEFYIPFYHVDKNKERKLSVKVTPTGLYSGRIYFIRYPSVIRKYYGIHFGYNRINYSNIEYGVLDRLLLDGLITNEIFAGLGFERKSSVKAEVQTNNGFKSTGEFRKFGVYADILFFTGTNTEYSNIKMQTIGYRIYADLNRMWLYNKVYFGINAKLGLQYGPIKDSFAPFVGFGLSFGI